jgi:hypothetical protein
MLLEYLKERGVFVELGVGGRMILKLILKEQDRDLLLD